MLLLLICLSFSSAFADLKKNYFLQGNDYAVFVEENHLSFVYSASKSGSVKFRVDLSYSDLNEIHSRRLPCSSYKDGKTFECSSELRIAGSHGEVIELRQSDDNILVSISGFKEGALSLEGAEAVLIENHRTYFLSAGHLLPVDLRLASDPEHYHVALSSLFAVPVLEADRSTGNWATYAGGNNDDAIVSIAKAGSRVFVCGTTLSTDLPVSPGAFQDSLKGSYDVFVSAYSLSGQKLWSTYFGGSSIEIPSKIVTDKNGHLFFSGYTSSTDLPVIGSPYQDSLSGTYDAFLVKLDTSGAVMVSGYFGGAASDFGYTMAVDSSGNVMIGGGTSSLDLPTNSSSTQQVHGGSIDAFVARFDQDLDLLWCTYFGGAGAEDMHAMTSDDSLAVIFSGGTFSADFPTFNGMQMTSNGGMDAYVVKISVTGLLRWSTYFGGTGNDDSFGLATDKSMNVFVSGQTNSNDLSFVNAFQSNPAGANDTYVLNLEADGSFIRGTCFGGTADEQNSSCDVEGELFFISGTTFSSDLPVDSLAFQKFNAGGSDGFYAVFDTSLQFRFAGYFGGNSFESATAIIGEQDSTFFLAGRTFSTNLPFVIAGDQPVKAGGEDGFLASIDLRSFLVSKESEKETAPNVLIYPLPFHQDLIVETGAYDYSQLLIKDLNGRMVYSSQVCGRTVISPNIASGLYILQVVTESGTMNYRIIKN